MRLVILYPEGRDWVSEEGSDGISDGELKKESEGTSDRESDEEPEQAPERESEGTSDGEPEEVEASEIDPEEEASELASDVTSEDGENEYIYIELKTLELDADYEYEALSYTWGDSTPFANITVISQNGSARLQVAQNLYSALVHLRRPDRKRLLWIDAICINQTDLDEKNVQVRRMDIIYTLAHTVVVWLGPEADNSDRVMYDIRSLSVNEIDRLVADEENNTRWRAMMTFMKRPWFSRRWIIQEIAFARQAVVLCGTRSVTWEELCEAVSLFTEVVNAMPQLSHQPLKPKRRPGNSRLGLFGGGVAWVAVAVLSGTMGGFSGLKNYASISTTAFRQGIQDYAKKDLIVDFATMLGGPGPIGEVAGFGAPALVAALGQMARKDDGGERVKHLCTLEELLSQFTAFEASNPRDIVYALLSLCRDSLSLKVDYKKPVSQVCIEAIEQIVSTSGSLNTILRPWSPMFPGPPSWITQTSSLPFVANNEASYVRTRSDPLIGAPNQCPYNACGLYKAVVSFQMNCRGSFLKARGFRLKTIHLIGEVAKDGILPPSWANSFRGEDAHDGMSVDIYWRLLVGNRDSDGNTAQSWYGRAFSEILSERDGIDTTRFLQRQRQFRTSFPDMDLTINGRVSSAMAKFLRRVQGVTCRLRNGTCRNVT
jgi:hypothetical protein